MSRNFDFAYAHQAPHPDIAYPLNAKSETINVGDPLVLTTDSDETTGSTPVARVLLAADVSASYQEGGATAGIYGFAAASAVTDASGVASSAPAYANKLASAEPTLQVPTYGASIDVDPNIGYTRIKTFVAHPHIVFRGKLGGGGTTTASAALIGTSAGIDIASGVFTVDTSESVKPLTIVGWDQSNPAYVFFTVKPAYCQALTGVLYTSQ